MKNLEKIKEKYQNVNYNSDNYSIGGLLDNCKFASRRHEDAKSDEGKETMGKVAQMFKKATGLEISEINEIIEFAFPNMEWHHAGKLPKAYGGGMKKTYFLNSDQIKNLAENWNVYLEKINIKKEKLKILVQEKNNIEKLRQEFLNVHGKLVTRVEKRSLYFYETDREMNGKFGWFSSYGKSYNMTEYFTGYEFESQEILDLFRQI